MEKPSGVNISVEEEWQPGTKTAPPLRQSARRLATSLYRFGKTVASTPLALLPEQSRGHMRAAGNNLEEAGKEFGRGLAAAMRAIAANIEEMAEDASKEPQS